MTPRIWHKRLTRSGRAPRGGVQEIGRFGRLPRALLTVGGGGLVLLASGSALAYGLPALQQRLQAGGPVQGTFSQARYLKALPRPLSSQGEFRVQPGQSLLWHVRKPFEQQVRIDRDGLQYWNGSRWQRDDRASGTAGQTQLGFFRDLIEGRFDRLAQHFTPTLQGNDEHWQLHLVPASGIMKQIFVSIDVTGDAYVRNVQLVEVQGDRLELSFSALRHAD